MAETLVCMNQDKHKHLEATDLPSTVRLAKFYSCLVVLNFLINFSNPQCFHAPVQHTARSNASLVMTPNKQQISAKTFILSEMQKFTTKLVVLTCLLVVFLYSHNPHTEFSVVSSWNPYFVILWLER
jgi:hypothetical protein